MKTITIFAAMAAVIATTAMTISVHAGPPAYEMPADEAQVCRLLELAHESSCAEYEAKLIRQYAATSGVAVEEVTGSIPTATETSGR